MLLSIVGVVILLPLVVAVVYLARSSKYTGNYVRRETLAAYFQLMKPSLALRYISYFCCTTFNILLSLFKVIIVVYTNHLGAGPL